MNKYYDEWTPFSSYCSNCGTIVTGYRNSAGLIKIECPRCHVSIVRKIISRRHDRFDVFAPEGQEHII